MTENSQPILDVLRNELCRLTIALKSYGIILYIGGGYGLLLRQKYVMEGGARTLRHIPPERSTEDLDIYLTAEVIVDVVAMRAIRDTLRSLDYTGVEEALYYQFAKPVMYRGQTRTIKIDILAALPTASDQLATLKVSKRRVRPRAVKKIHAHPSPEASIITDTATEIELSGCDTSVTIMLPHPFVYASLKLHVYRDRHDDEEKDFARHHAFDLYRVVAMMTENEWTEAIGLRDKYIGEETVADARSIVKEYFGSEYATGTLALREYAKTVRYELSDETIQSFLADLVELFPAPKVV